MAASHPKRNLGLLVVLASLAAFSFGFYYRQNYASQIGGPMSVPKLLWLDYALIAWFVLLYISVSWLPPYGIAHDLFVMGLISGLLALNGGRRGELVDPANRAALRFLSSIRLGLACEILFAWLFYRATQGQVGIYFASTDPLFARINALSWAVVLVAYPDLVRTVWAARELLFPRPSVPEAEVSHA
jgi:hypothetical protein